MINEDIFSTTIIELEARHLYLSHLLENDAVHPRTVSNKPEQNPTKARCRTNALNQNLGLSILS